MTSRPATRRPGPLVVAAVGLAMLGASCIRPGLASRGAALAATGVRSFRMGFTTKPGGPTDGRVNSEASTIEFVRTNADLIVLHRDGPIVPWRALAQGRLDRFQAQLEAKRARYGDGIPLYVLITPLNVFRNGVGGGFPSDLGRACMSNTRLRTAFMNYAQVVVTAMHPDYLGLMAEANMYKPPARCPGDFDALVSLYKETYQAVKAQAPSLPVFATFQLDFLHLSNDQLLPGRFAPELDVLALSLYPSGNLTRLAPNAIPDDYIHWARAAVPNLPLVIAETGYGSQAAGGSVGSPQEQTAYVQWLLDHAQQEQAQFVTWFFSTDPRYVHAPPGLEFLNSFRSMGLVTPSFKPKPAFAVWSDFLSRELVPPPG
jgi:hypothetical protein